MHPPPPSFRHLSQTSPPLTTNCLGLLSCQPSSYRAPWRYQLSDSTPRGLARLSSCEAQSRSRTQILVLNRVNRAHLPIAGNLELFIFKDVLLHTRINGALVWTNGTMLEAIFGAKINQ